MLKLSRDRIVKERRAPTAGNRAGAIARLRAPGRTRGKPDSRVALRRGFQRIAREVRPGGLRECEAIGRGPQAGGQSSSPAAEQH
jgi:hypothetical protein